ncbi:hypothetical protein CPB86DRAFT_91111 [Serendipita vermifera]|nr:hypothetical protein CPB86DRAFT_91111 [Serendipita vermifera]
MAKKGGPPEHEKEKTGRSTADSNATMLISLKTSVEDLIAENNALFELKFESLQSAIGRSEQRIITELRAGPHERVLHPDVREVWKEMRWRTFVKARHFVLSLHDYYQDRISGLLKAPEGSPDMTAEEKEAELVRERWCLQFLTAQYVSDLLVAVDVDASGYIRITEANEFTSSIPPNWTPPEWLAFWAQGWHYELETYRYRLAWIWAEMFRVYQEVLPENRTIMIDYLQSGPLYSVHDILISVQAPLSVDPSLSALVEAHMALTEEKLSKILSATRYQIENSDSTQPFFGNASLEMYILPLLYLVLRHHLDVMRFGKVEILDQREMKFAEDTLGTIMRTVRERNEFLKVCCDQRHQSVKEYLAFFAHGIYVNTLGRDTEEVPDMLAEIEEFSSLQHAGVDRWDPSVTCLFTQETFDNVKANLRLPLMDKKEGDPRWDAYFKDGLSSLGAEEQRRCQAVPRRDCSGRRLGGL